MQRKPWTEAEFQQLLQLISGIHRTINSIPEGSRLLLEANGCSRTRLDILKRGTYQLTKALHGVLGKRAS